MNIDKIPAGKNPPSDINVVIEITGGAGGGAPVKYEIDKDSGAVFVDRRRDPLPPGWRAEDGR